MPGARDTLNTLVERYDPEVLDPPPTRARVRLEVADRGAWDVLLEPGRERLTEAAGEPDALLGADAETWRRVASDLRGGMDADGRDLRAPRRTTVLSYAGIQR